MSYLEGIGRYRIDVYLSIEEDHEMETVEEIKDFMQGAAAEIVTDRYIEEAGEFSFDPSLKPLTVEISDAEAVELIDWFASLRDMEGKGMAVPVVVDEFEQALLDYAG